MRICDGARYSWAVAGACCWAFAMRTAIRWWSKCLDWGWSDSEAIDSEAIWGVMFTIISMMIAIVGVSFGGGIAIYAIDVIVGCGAISNVAVLSIQALCFLYRWYANLKLEEFLPIVYG